MINKANTPYISHELFWFVLFDEVGFLAGFGGSDMRVGLEIELEREWARSRWFGVLRNYALAATIGQGLRLRFLKEVHKIQRVSVEAGTVCDGCNDSAGFTSQGWTPNLETIFP